MVVVKIFSSRQEAQVVQLFLASHHIQALIQGDDQGGMSPALALSAGVRLLVDSCDFERAKKLIEEGSNDAE